MIQGSIWAQYNGSVSTLWQKPYPPCGKLYLPCAALWVMLYLDSFAGVVNIIKATKDTNVFN